MDSFVGFGGFAINVVTILISIRITHYEEPISELIEATEKWLKNIERELVEVESIKIQRLARKRHPGDMTNNGCHRSVLHPSEVGSFLPLE